MKKLKLLYARFRTSTPAKFGVAGFAFITAVGGLFSAWGSISSVFSGDKLNAKDILMDFRLAPYNDEELTEMYVSIETNAGYTTVLDYGTPVIENRKVCDYFMHGFDESRDLYDVWQLWSEPESPIFDLKIVNNGNKTLVIDNVIINIDKSVPDTRPMPIAGTLWQYGELFKCAVINRGWGDWKECSFEYKVKMSGYQYIEPFCISIPTTDSAFIFDLEPLLKQSGINTVYFLDNFSSLNETKSGSVPDLAEALKEVGHCYVVREDGFNINTVIEGNFEMTNQNGEIVIIPVSFFVPLMIEGLGDGYDPGRNFIVELRPEGENYKLEFPSSFTVAPNEAERFLITMTTPQSSWHTFSITLGNINGIKLNTGKTKLYTFTPKPVFHPMYFPEFDPEIPEDE